MSAVVYNKFKEKMLAGTISLSSNTVKAQLIDLNDYTFVATHEFLSDLTTAAPTALIGPSATLTSKTFTNGVFDAADVTIPAVTGDAPEAVVLFIDTGSAATSTLIGIFDGITLNPNGSDVIVAWNNGATRILSVG